MQNILQNAIRFYRLKLNQTLPNYKRFVFDLLLNSKVKITGLYGSRGVGKDNSFAPGFKRVKFQ